MTILNILIFLLCSLVALLYLIVRQMVQDEKKTFVEHEITSYSEYQSAVILKDAFKAHLKIEIGCVATMTRFELWAWSTALREIVIEMNQSQTGGNVSASAR